MPDHPAVESEEKHFVLDTSAIYNATDYPTGMLLYSTPGVLRELRRVYREERAGLFVAARLQIFTPCKKSIEAVREAARRTGDISRLSPVDVEVLAASHEIRGVLVTDDYSMQNTARSMGIEFVPVNLPPIRDLREWRLRCKSCGATYPSADMKECAVCGGKLVTVRKN